MSVSANKARLLVFFSSNTLFQDLGFQTFSGDGQELSHPDFGRAKRGGRTVCCGWGVGFEFI